MEHLTLQDDHSKMGEKRKSWPPRTIEMDKQVKKKKQHKLRQDKQNYKIVYKLHFKGLYVCAHCLPIFCPKPTFVFSYIQNCVIFLLQVLIFKLSRYCLQVSSFCIHSAHIRHSKCSLIAHNVPIICISYYRHIAHSEVKLKMETLLN